LTQYVCSTIQFVMVFRSISCRILNVSIWMSDKQECPTQYLLVHLYWFNLSTISTSRPKSVSKPLFLQIPVYFMNCFNQL
jgi:hypothetical protein